MRVFSYGTLQLQSVQRATFGRDLVGVADALVGFEQRCVTIAVPDVITASGTDRHPIVVPTGGTNDRVVGTVFELSAQELAGADLYEVDDYRRIRARLASGHDAWVYLGARV